MNKPVVLEAWRWLTCNTSFSCSGWTKEVGTDAEMRPQEVRLLLQGHLVEWVFTPSPPALYAALKS